MVDCVVVVLHAVISSACDEIGSSICCAQVLSECTKRAL